MKRLLTLSLCLMIVMLSFAHDFEVGGIYYKITTSTEPYTVAVTYRGTSYSSYSDEYTGSVTIPETVDYSGKTYSVTSIGEWAFDGCSGLTSVTIPNSVTSIGQEAFKDCSSLTSITIPNSVTSIGTYAFSGTVWYNNQPDGLVYAGKVAYKYKGTMPWNTSIAIKDGTLGIAGYAFYECRGLKSVNIPNGVTNIGERAFADCSNLTSITIPNSVTSIGNYTFYGCSGLESITIPNSMTSIGSDAFNSCSGLASVTIPASVTNIGDRAFIFCSGLKSVTIPNSVTSIGGEAFYGCKGLTSITIPNSVTSIGWRAFGGCYGLTSVTIPNSVTSISDQAFSDCRNLTSVTIPNSVKAIGSHMFDQCFSLASVNIPESVTSIGEYAFFRCSSLKSVTIPNSVTYIGSYAFNSCGSLASFTIPNSVTSIGDLVFEGTPWYENQPDGVVYAGKVAYKHKGAMPTNTNITIDEGSLGIASSAFYYCINMTSITIPNSVTSIGLRAFYECSGLTEIVSYIQEPFALTQAWDYVPQNIPLYVPAGTMKKYQSTDGWKHLTNMIEFGADAIEPTEEAMEVNMTVVPSQMDLNGMVVGDTYYALNKDNGDGTDKEDGCVVINSITTDEAVSSIVGKEISDESVKDAFKGIIFMVPAGTGKVSVTGQTVGSSSLMVKVGSLPAQAFQLAERETVQIPYTVTEPTYVYIYAGNAGATAARGTAATETAENSVKVYSYKWEPTETTGIEEIDNRQLTIHNSHRVKGIYTLTGVKVSDDAADLKTLPRGLYIVNGKKVAVK